MADQIIIHPNDLQEIVDTLAAHPFETGPVIIRDTGNEFIIRDQDEQYLATIEKTIDQDG